MCGIVGVVSKKGTLYSEQIDVFEELLYADALRGMDSTGAFGVTSKNQVNAAKQAVEPGIFYRTKVWKDFKNTLYRSRLAIGHNRKATVGDVVTENAHPFVKNGMALVHNGFISNHKSIDANVTVDSESILTALATEESAAKAFDKMWGAWAVVWYNHKTRKLHMVRNDQRPLTIAHAGDYLYMGSEPEMVAWILRRRKIPFQTPIMLNTNTLYTINVDNYELFREEMPRTPVVHVPSQSRGRWSPISGVWEGDDCANPEDVDILNPDPEDGPDAEFSLEPVKPKDDETKKVIKEMMERYPQGTFTLFRPLGFNTIDGEVHVKGWVFTPGKEPGQAIYTVAVKDDDEVYINYSIPLIASISAVQRRGNEIHYVVDSLIKSEVLLKDWNSNQIPQEEWNAIVNGLGCDKCAKGISRSEIEATIIHRPTFMKGQDGKIGKDYTIICATCVGNAYSKQASGS